MTRDDTKNIKYTDPLTLNLYEYALDNPVSNTDPTGKDAATAVEAIDYTAAAASFIPGLDVAAWTVAGLATGAYVGYEIYQANLTDSPGSIANQLGRTTREIKNAIEKVKQGNSWRSGANNRNPDVMVDPDTGEVYPQTPDGGTGDSIGNINDHLPEK